MPNLVLKSERQIQTQILQTLIAELGLNDINAGSVIDILTQAVAQEDFAQYVQMAQIARLVNLDAITGDDLDNKAFEFGLTRNSAEKATGKITILRPASFEKVSTQFFAGTSAPIIGDTVINVNDASNALFGSSGTLILGRGTTTEEEVTYTTAPVDNVNFWTFTVSSLAKNHSVEESVILKQGNDELIIAGTTVIVPSTGTSAEISFTTNTDVTLLAGEDRVEDVEVTAVLAGTDGNIPVLAINGTEAFPTPPFAGARAQNDIKFTTGKNRETDNELRDRIKDHIQALSKGIKLAIQNAIVGLVEPESAKRVISANIILPQEECEGVDVYIDDGTGFEPSFEAIGFEELVGSSTGGEKRLQLDLSPLVKAQAETSSEEPYNMSGGVLNLTLEVGTITETIPFTAGDFEFPDAARAEEIVTVINDRSNLVEARTSQVGKKVVISAKENTNEDLQVQSGGANTILNFPTDLKSTLFLYIDDQLKSKDGKTATLDTDNDAPYNMTALGTLDIIVDGKSANPQTITFQAGDFVDIAAATTEEISARINAELSGALASSINNDVKVRLSSNTLLSESSKIQVTGGTANSILGFPTIESSGIDGDYTLNKELGTIELKDPLGINQSVTIGSNFTRASLRAAFSELYAPANGETLIVSIDRGANQTIVFDSSFVAGKTAEDTATYINSFLKGGTAIVREVGVEKFIEIRTNSFEEGVGYIEIDGTSSANAKFGFTTDVEITNQRPHQAYQVSGNSGPFEFPQSSNLIVVMDDDIVGSTYSVLMDYPGSITNGSSTTIFSDSNYLNIFENNDELIDFYAAFTSGDNSTSGTIIEVKSVGGLAATNEQQRLLFSNTPNSGNFTITFDGQTTGNIAYTAAAGDVQTALEALSNIGAGNVSVSGAFAIGFTIEFIGALAATNLPEITAASSLLLDINELQNLAFSAVPDSGNFTLTFDTKTTTALPFNATAASIEAALEALTNIGAGNVSVSGNFANDFLIEFTGTLAATDVAEITVASSLLIGALAVTASVATSVDGSSTSSTITPETLVIGEPGGQPANTWRFIFDALPANLSDFAINDLFKTENLTEASNNGYFIITGISAKDNGYIEVLNTEGVVESGSSGDGLVSQRRQITAYTALTGQITVGSPFRSTPAVSDSFIVLPSTISNLVDYINNIRVTSLNVRAFIEGVNNNTQLQISSKQAGSNGHIQVSGGSANNYLNFSNDSIRGLQAYNYYTGLLELVHKTIYGDDRDLVAFPGVGAAGVTFRVLAPTVRELFIDINAILEEGKSISSLENEIKSAIINYINTLGIGDDVIIEKLKSVVIDISGVKDIILNLPSENIAISDNELARTKSSNIIVG